MTLRTGGRTRRLARLLHGPMTSPTIIVKGLLRVNLGVLGMAIHAFLNLLTLLPGVMALLAVLQGIGMLFVVEWSPLVLIRRVKPGIVDGGRVRLTEDALQDEQGSKEHNRSDNRNEFFVHETLTSFLLIPLFTKFALIIAKTTLLSRKKWRISTEFLGNTIVDSIDGLNNIVQPSSTTWLRLAASHKRLHITNRLLIYVDKFSDFRNFF
jgi:hypothetical protein